MYSEILIRYGELSLKGKNKMIFVRKLAKNILNLTGIKTKVMFDRMNADYSPENLELLSNVFGIYSLSPVVLIKSEELKDLEKTIFKLLEERKFNTFKVITKRRHKGYKLNSDELNNHIGAFVLKNFPDSKVSLKNPDLKIEIDIRKNEIRLFTDRVLGLGGLPTGINGKVLHLLSGGIDSPVAAFEMMKRGIHVDFLNFITPPHTDKKTVDKVDAIIKLLVKYQGYAKLHQVNYTDLMNLIGLTSKQSYKITLMRRSFYRIANKIANKDRCLGLSNGENIGQVASQTLESINVIASQSKLPIYRPVLTSDKLEIIAKANKIKSYDISIIRAAESCELFAPKAPVTKPNIRIAHFLEQKLPGIFELEEAAIDKINLKEFKINI